MAPPSGYLDGMDIVLAVLALLNGGWMIADGIRVITTGAYFGTELGPWAGLLRRLGLEPLRMGPVFVALGAVWILGCVLIFAAPTAGAWVLAGAGVATLWYLPIGTAISVLTLVTLLWS